MKPFEFKAEGKSLPIRTCARPFAMADKLPQSILVVTVDCVQYQCQKALVRSHLWDPAGHVPKSELPSAGQMLEALSNKEIDGAAFDKAYPEKVKKTIY